MRFSSDVREAKMKFWKGHLVAWKASGLSQAEYSRRSKIPHQSLSYWWCKERPGSLASLSVAPLAD